MRVYLSSSFSARDSGAEELLQLRLELQQRGKKTGVDVVLGEQDSAIEAGATAGNHMEILEGCVRLMGSCDAFFGMLFERHGTPVVLAREPAEARAAVSFFEAELLEACITNKPTCVALIRNMVPSAAMHEFLNLVRPALWNAIIEIDRVDLARCFDNFCDALTKKRIDSSPWLFDHVSIGRLQRAVGHETREPKLGFLGGLLREDGDGAIDETVLHTAIQRVEAGKDAEGRSLGQLAKLSYLWIAVRELARAPIEVRIHDLGNATKRVLQLWNSSAAWYGLHGAHPMGCLATLNELTYVQRQLRSGAAPLGPRASAYYSIGSRMRSVFAARRFYRQCLTLAREVLSGSPNNPSNALQLTASANGQLGRRGEPWRYLIALDEFRRSLDWRVQHQAGDDSIGEAKTAYAHTLFELPWRRREAVKLAAEGVALIKHQPGGASNPLYFRAARQYAEMLGRMRQREEALEVATEARDFAVERQAFDQVNQLQGLINGLISGRIR